MSLVLMTAALRLAAVPLVPWLLVDVVAGITADLNYYGTAARRAFLDEFGCPPAELPPARLDAAVEFVHLMRPF